MISMFMRTNRYNILILGYEMVRKHSKLIISSKQRDNQIGLLICDEGHRLKNQSGNRTINAIKSINCRKRMILTGTPFQNRLSELYAMVDFVNPGILGSYDMFKNQYSKPIEQSRDINCKKEIKRIGDARSDELHKITNKFILRRRQNDIMGNYLPPKNEYIIFHKMSTIKPNIQFKLYQNILQSQRVSKVLEKGCYDSNALSCILNLRLLTNCPQIIVKKFFTYQATKASKLSNKNGFESSPSSQDNNMCDFENCSQQLTQNIKS